MFAKPAWLTRRLAILLLLFLIAILAALIFVRIQEDRGLISNKNAEDQSFIDQYTGFTHDPGSETYQAEYPLGKVDGKSELVLLVTEASQNKYKLELLGQLVAEIESKIVPKVLGLINGDLRFIVSRQVGNLDEITIYNPDKTTKELASEGKDFVLIPKSVSTDNNKLLFSKITAKMAEEGCGGGEQVKVPDRDGPVFQLRLINLTTEENILLIEDERKPVGNSADSDLTYNGLEIIGFSSNSDIAYAKRIEGGCGDVVTALTYAIPLHANSAVKVIDYTATLTKESPEDFIYFYPSGITGDGRYLIYREVAIRTGGLVGKTVLHKFDLQTATDTVVSSLN